MCSCFSLTVNNGQGSSEALTAPDKEKGSEKEKVVEGSSSEKEGGGEEKEKIAAPVETRSGLCFISLRIINRYVNIVVLSFRSPSEKTVSRILPEQLFLFMQKQSDMPRLDRQWTL